MVQKSTLFLTTVSNIWGLWRCLCSERPFWGQRWALKWDKNSPLGSCKVAKTGSLCCVAARPHGSSTVSREWSVGRNEPFWRSNSSFSPPLSRRWDYWFHSEGLQYGSQGGSGAAVYYGSSLSSNSKGSRSWGRGDPLADHHYSTSDGAISYLSSPSDSFQNQQLTPPHVQGVNFEEFIREPAPEHLAFSRFVEGTSGPPYSAGSTSSRSDGSEYESTSRSHASAHRNFSSRRSFMSKPIHPVSFPDNTLGCEEGHDSASTTHSNNSHHSDFRSIRALAELQSPGLFENVGNPQKESAQWSSAGSSDFTDVSEPLEPDSLGPSCNNTYEGAKCGLCERLLSQRSPWGSRRIVRSGDMPIAGVLSCWHVYHAECLERATPKMQKHDPPCPLCEKSEENASEQWVHCRLKNGLPRLMSLGEEGPSSRAWSCVKAGDCVEGALHAPKRGSMMLLSRSRLKRNLSLKGNLANERAENSKKSGFCSPQMLHGHVFGDQGAVGCSTVASGPALKR